MNCLRSVSCSIISIQRLWSAHRRSFNAVSEQRAKLNTSQSQSHLSPAYSTLTGSCDVARPGSSSNEIWLLLGRNITMSCQLLLLLKQSSVFNVHVYTQSTAVASNMAAVIEARDRYDFAMNQVTNTYDFPVLFLLYCRDASSGCCHRDSSITCINHSVIKHSTFISCRRHVLCVAFRETIFLAVFLSFCVFPSVSLII